MLNSGSAFWTVNSVPRAFSEKAASKCSSVISPSLPCSPVPALAHNTSIAPRRSYIHLIVCLTYRTGAGSVKLCTPSSTDWGTLVV